MNGLQHTLIYTEAHAHQHTNMMIFSPLIPSSLCKKFPCPDCSLEKWNKSGLICHFWIIAWAFCLIYFLLATLLCARSFQHLLLRQLRSAKQETLRWAQCFTLFHYPINRKPSQSTVLPLTLCRSPHAAASPFQISHWAVAFPAHCLWRWDSAIKRKRLPRGTADCECMRSSEELGEGKWSE